MDTPSSQTDARNAADATGTPDAGAREPRQATGPGSLRSLAHEACACVARYPVCALATAFVAGWLCGHRHHWHR